MPLAQGGIDVGQTFEMHPTEGPVGTPIEIRVKGLGWRTLESTWVVNWDNQEVGWVSATDTRGSAVARFRAAGAIGEHQVKLYTGYMGQGYLNHEQAPNSYLPRPGFRVPRHARQRRRPRHSQSPIRSSRCRDSHGGQRRSKPEYQPHAGSGADARVTERKRLPAERASCRSSGKRRRAIGSREAGLLLKENEITKLTVGATDASTSR